MSAYDQALLIWSKSRGGSAWWSVGLIGRVLDQMLLGHPKVAGSNPVPDTMIVDGFTGGGL